MRRVAGILNDGGYAVYADDHRGHGRTAAQLERFGLAGTGAWDAMVTDARLLTEHITEAHPGLPIVLLGHSMGSFILQDYLLRWGDGFCAAVLTGSGGTFTEESRADADAYAAQLDAAIAQEGRDVPSTVFAERFIGYNDPFVADAPGGVPTGFEWLSRDPDEVRRYVEDPWCGRPLSNGFVADMMAARKTMSAPDATPASSALPVLLMSGDRDPVGGADAERVRQLGDRYRSAGLTVTVRIYPGARHELFNETNRDEVHRDLLRVARCRRAVGGRHAWDNPKIALKFGWLRADGPSCPTQAGER